GGDVTRRYKLRLSDGTILNVDQDGLKTWRVDKRAMVQAGGGQWRPLRELLAMQDAAEKYATQGGQPVPERPALPLIPPSPRKKTTPGAPPPPVVEPHDTVEPPVIADAGPAPLSAEPIGEGEAAPVLDGAPEDEAPVLATDEPSVPAPGGSSVLTTDEPPVFATEEPPVPEAWADEPEVASKE